MIIAIIFTFQNLFIKIFVKNINVFSLNFFLDTFDFKISRILTYFMEYGVKKKLYSKILKNFTNFDTFQILKILPYLQLQ